MSLNVLNSLYKFFPFYKLAATACVTLFLFNHVDTQNYSEYIYILSFITPVVAFSGGAFAKIIMTDMPELATNLESKIQYVDYYYSISSKVSLIISTFLFIGSITYFGFFISTVISLYIYVVIQSYPRAAILNSLGKYSLSSINEAVISPSFYLLSLVVINQYFNLSIDKLLTALFISSLPGYIFNHFYLKSVIKIKTDPIVHTKIEYLSFAKSYKRFFSAGLNNGLMSLTKSIPYFVFSFYNLDLVATTFKIFELFTNFFLIINDFIYRPYKKMISRFKKSYSNINRILRRPRRSVLLYASLSMVFSLVFVSLNLDVENNVYLRIKEYNVEFMLMMLVVFLQTLFGPLGIILGIYGHYNYVSYGLLLQIIVFVLGSLLLFSYLNLSIIVLLFIASIFARLLAYKFYLYKSNYRINLFF